MAPITPWLATLVETELENVIAWKSIVKPDPDASEEQRSRFSDDGSNLRSVVGSPPLGSESTLQLLEKPGSNARAKMQVSDGEASILATLSDSAWDAYDKDLEEGEETRKGDLLLCKKVTIVSTTYGPSEERVKLRIEDLELTGNFRKVIGQPASLLQRASIIASQEKIGKLREIPMGNNEDDEEMGDVEEEEEEEEEEDEGDVENDAEGGDNLVEPGSDDEEVAANIAKAAQNTVPTTHTPSENPKGQLATAHSTSPHQLTSPSVPNTNSMAQIESQLPEDAMQTQPPPKSRDPIRRTRGGFSMGREGLEPTRGDNLTGPQAPSLHARQVRLSMEPPEPPKNMLLDVISKLPGQAPKKRSPEPSAPVSAQLVTEEVIVETPAKAKAKRSPEASTAQESTPAPRKRYRIPRDQKELLDNPSSWIPSARGQEFPHPNVPIGLLKAWNAKATGVGKSPSQPSPIAMIEERSMAKSLEEVRPEPQATAAAELESESDEAETSEDEPISDWSESPSRSQRLPPDSSAAHLSPAASCPGSRDGAMSGSERIPIAIAEDAQSVSSGGRRGASESGNSRQEEPQWKRSVASQTPINSGRQSGTQTPKKTPSGTHQNREHLPKTLNTTQRLPRPDSRPSSNRVSNIPSSSMRSPAVSTASRSPAISHPLPARPEGPRAPPTAPSNWKQPPVAPRASQPIPIGPKNSQPLADNHHGPIRASTQRAPDKRRRSISPPPSAPTGPRASIGPRYSLPNRHNSNSGSDREPAARGDFYRPSSSSSRGGGNAPVDRRQPGGTQTPNSTVEMESGAPRALPPNKYHQDRSAYYRDAQRRQWLELNFPTESRVPVSAPRLLQSYRERYARDPVTEQDFRELIRELRPNASETRQSTTPTAGAPAIPQSTLAAETPAIDRDGQNEMMEERDGNGDLATHPNEVFAEFVSGWRNIRPGGAFAKEAARLRPQQRRLDVLSWGFDQ